MGVHPNVILMAVFTPDDLARKTYRAVLGEAGIEVDDDDPTVTLADGRGYRLMVMEDDYDEGFQVSAPEGSIVAHDFLTYDYGEKVEWGKIVEAHGILIDWAKGICERHHCSVQVFITANYW